MDLGTFLLLVFIFCFVWISWSISVAYKKRFSRNMLLTGTSVGVLAAQFFMAISSGGLKIHDASTAMTFQNDIAPGLFWFGIFILLFCLIKNVVNSNPIWGFVQTGFQFIYMAILSVIILVRIMAGTDKTMRELYTEPLIEPKSV